jgi:hypothetical protein
MNRTVLTALAVAGICIGATGGRPQVIARELNRHNDATIGYDDLAAVDVGVDTIVAPGSIVMTGAIQPRARISNYGTDPQSNIPVTCWIDSGTTRVYTSTKMVVGPLAGGAWVIDTFPTPWSGSAHAHYKVTVFTGLGGDLNPNNDTMVGTTYVSGAVYSDTIRVRRIDSSTPTIDGVIDPGEWAPSVEYDISDIAGRGGTPYPAGSVSAYFLYDTTGGFLYCAADIPSYNGGLDNNMYVITLDENHDGAWATDSSEGLYWVEYVSGDSVIFLALLDTVSQYWRYGETPGAVSVSSTLSGHLQFETKLPLGAGKSQISVQPGDTVGCSLTMEVSGGTVFPGFWPQSMMKNQWRQPRYYGTMIFDPLSGIQESPKSGFALYKANPSITRDQTRISYYVTGHGNVTLGVYDAAGKLVRTLASSTPASGVRTATWDGTDNSGRTVARGAYLYRLAVDGRAVTGKTVVLH